MKQAVHAFDENMAVWGYARVSSKDQNLDRQIAALAPLVTTESHLVVEKMSGKDFARPMYQSLMNLIREGDELVVLSLDRLGRNYKEINEEIRKLRNKNIRLRILDMPILNKDFDEDDLTMNLIYDVVIELLGYVAESERRNIRARQAEGIAIAKAQGKHLGRPNIVLPDNWEEVIALWQSGKITAVEAMRRTGMKRTSFYKMVHVQGTEKNRCR